MKFDKKNFCPKKVITKHNTTKELELQEEKNNCINHLKKIDNFNKKIKVNNIRLSTKLEEGKKSKSSLCTISTTTSELINNRTIKSKKKNSKLSKKFIEAQSNWRKNYYATFIQKMFRGFYFREIHKNILNKTNTIYKKKKIQVMSNFKQNLKSYYQNCPDNNKHKETIKTFIIDKFGNRKKCISNDLMV